MNPGPVFFHLSDCKCCCFCTLPVFHFYFSIRNYFMQEITNLMLESCMLSSLDRHFLITYFVTWYVLSQDSVVWHRSLVGSRSEKRLCYCSCVNVASNMALLVLSLAFYFFCVIIKFYFRFSCVILHLHEKLISGFMHSPHLMF